MFAETVEKLTIKAGEDGYSPRDKLITQFPQLKVLHLKINSIDTIMLQGQWIADIDAENIEELKLSIRSDERATHCLLKVLADMIGNMKTLKILDLSDCAYDVASYMLEYGQFCLPNLEVLKTEVIDYFDAFKKSLKTAVVIGNISESCINDFLSQYIKVESLEFESCLYDPNCSHEFKVNKKIKNLSLKTSDYLVNALLVALPELETLYVPSLTKNLMKFVADKNRKLKQVKFSEIEDGTMEKFEEMQRQGQKEVNLDIKLIQE
jgi:hypothetical protein